MRVYFLIITLNILFLPLYPLELSTDAFVSNGNIPKTYTCDGKNFSPRLTWQGAPSNTESFVLICEDPDAPSGIWSHWVIYNIPKEINSLEESFPKSIEIFNGIRQGVNDFGNIGYDGPCPPPYKPHRYFFRLYALDTKLSFDKDVVERRDVLEAMKDHVIDEAYIVGIYKR